LIKEGVSDAFKPFYGVPRVHTNSSNVKNLK
jgi:hypothetical protein